ncbi:MAG: NAD-dependent deacylase [Verrucomicrobiae bacterium]|nr:NAD-dependent deacylase [Verrucomicrobiae bacterium]NNJ86559.1 NAD-dependent deacylase [Akkermansiaceae bacterium]
MKNIFILTGAGISAESGLRTFRDGDGLWEGHKVEEVATPGAFAVDPELVHDFYNMRRSQLLNAEPNLAHHALVRLKRRYEGHLTLVTQNVDDLHERAGMRDVMHMHGELLKKRCVWCQKVSDCVSRLTVKSVCDDCGHEGTLRPHIVWFGEMPLLMDQIHEQLTKADLFVSIGTSGVVYPAAGFADEAKRHGAKLIEANLAGTEISPLFDEHLHGTATETVPQLVEELIALI